jgi:hypothetical protein
MNAYEKRLMEYLQQMELRMHGTNVRVDESIDQKCKEHCDNLRRELGLGQYSRKIFRAMALVIMLLLVYYFSGCSGGSRGSKLMLEWNCRNSLVVILFCELVCFECYACIFTKWSISLRTWQLKSFGKLLTLDKYLCKLLPKCINTTKM